VSLFASRVASAQQLSGHPGVDPASHLTASEFVRDIGADFAALFSTHSIIPLAVGAAGYGLATIPEQDLERHFARGDVWGAWADPGKYIGHPIAVGGAAVSLFAISRKSKNVKFRSFSYSLVQAMILAAPFTYTLKPAFHRLRPNGLDHMAFPSVIRSIRSCSRPSLLTITGGRPPSRPTPSRRMSARLAWKSASTT